MTLASIVERKRRRPSEQPVIAGVFVNRLRDPSFMPKRLQADPTVAYGCAVAPELASCAHFDGHLVTRPMLADTTNPYNTYRLDGLPPGPISNPGLSALRAALHPARTTTSISSPRAEACTRSATASGTTTRRSSSTAGTERRRR